MENTRNKTSKREMDKQKEVLKKLLRYCAYQERCHRDVREKIMSYDVYGDDLEEIMVYLIEQNYLNEERFAITYAGGKFRLKRWGRNKIRFELEHREISEYCIQKALNEIDEEEYETALTKLIEDQLNKDPKLDLLLAKDKTLKYCTGRGYEIDTVLRILRNY